MDKIYEKSETGCCPKFDPQAWDGREFSWNSKLFVKDRILSVFHMPINFGQVVTKNMEKISKAGAQNPDNLMISDENSMWGADVYIAVDKDIPGLNTAKISGTFLAKVFEGQYKEMGSWIKQMEEFVKSKGKTVKKLYFYYTTCPKCAKAYGKNYVVLLAVV
jgi:hypothetical protein